MQSTELIWIIKYGLYADSSPAQAQTNPQVMLLAWSYAGLAFKAQGLRYNLYYRTFCIFCVATSIAKVEAICQKNLAKCSQSWTDVLQPAALT